MEAQMKTAALALTLLITPVAIALAADPQQQALTKQIEQERLERFKLQAQVAEKQNELDALQQKLDQATRQLEAAQAEIERLKKQIPAEPSPPTNAPKPRYVIEQEKKIQEALEALKKEKSPAPQTAPATAPK
jgi:chromosome segregation ATPase